MKQTPYDRVLTGLARAYFRAGYSPFDSVRKAKGKITQFHQSDCVYQQLSVGDETFTLRKIHRSH